MIKKYSAKTLLQSILLVFTFAVSAIAQTDQKEVKRALDLLEFGNPDQVITDMKSLTASQPKNYEALAVLGMAYLDKGKRAEATEVIEMAFDLERRNSIVRNARGILFGKQGKKDDAIKEFQQALKYDDKDIFAYLNLARYYISVDSLKAAEIMLYRAQGVDANDVRPYLGLGELYDKQRVRELAIKQYQDALKLDPKNAVVYAQLARLYFRNRQYSESANAWIEVTKIDESYAQAYYEIGNLFFLGGQGARTEADAEKQFLRSAAFAEKFLTFEPNSLAGNWLAARALSETNQYTKALSYLEVSAKSDSLRPYTQLYLGRSYFASKDFTKANQIFAAANVLGPTDRYYYGISLISAGDTLKGIDQWKQSLVGDTIRSAEEKKRVHDQVVGMYRATKNDALAADFLMEYGDQTGDVEEYAKAGQIYTNIGSLDKAEAAFSKTVQANPSSVVALVGLADVYIKDSKKIDDATAQLEKASTAAKTPQESEFVGNAYARLGQAYLVQKNYQKSLDPLNTSLKYIGSQSNYYPIVNLMIASSLVQLKQYEKSREYLKKVLETDANNKDAKQLMQFIDAQKASGQARGGR